MPTQLRSMTELKEGYGYRGETVSASERGAILPFDSARPSWCVICIARLRLHNSRGSGCGASSSTGVDLKQNERVAIVAVGQWTTGGGGSQPLWVGPSGRAINIDENGMKSFLVVEWSSAGCAQPLQCLEHSERGEP
jgi:hypothetical protein